MSFRPKVGDSLIIENVKYQFTEHPAAVGMVYGQEGRAGIVFKLTSITGDQALKVFKPRFSTPGYVSQAEEIARYAKLTGLRVCERKVLTARRNGEVLRQHPELTYAVLMPWVEGTTWFEILLERTRLTPEQSLKLAKSLADMLAGMEERNLAHCDLSGSNLMVVNLEKAALELVDVEGMYAPGLFRPEVVPGGSPGYAHKSGPAGLWSPQADRFTGAVLLGEILGWSSSELRESAYGETYFDPSEMQKDCPRYHALTRYLGDAFGYDAARLYEEAWRSENLMECPTFGRWLVALPDKKMTKIAEGKSVSHSDGLPSSSLIISTLENAGEMEAEGIVSGALMLYRKALRMCKPDSEQAAEIERSIERLEKLGESDIVETEPIRNEFQSPALGNSVASLFENEKVDLEHGEWTQVEELLENDAWSESEPTSNILREELRMAGTGLDPDEAAPIIKAVTESNPIERPKKSTIPQPKTQRKRKIPGWAIALIAVLLIGVIASSGILFIGIIARSGIFRGPIGEPTQTIATVPFIDATIISTPIELIPPTPTSTIQIPPTEAPKATEVSPIAVPDTLRVWADDTRAPILRDLAVPLKEKYGVELVVELKSTIRDDFQTAAPTGDGPDIIIIAHDQAGTLVSNGLLAPVDLGEKAGDFVDNAKQACIFDGILYCMPFATENLGFFYNTDLVATPPTTWDEVVAVGEALKTAGKVEYIMAIPGTTYDIYPLFTSFGGYIFGKDDRGNWDPQNLGIDSEGMIAAATWLQDNVRKGNLPTDTDWNNNHVLFETGKTPFIIAGPWALDRIRQSGVKYAVTNFPDGGYPFANVQGFFINAQSENVLFAQVFLTEFVATDDVMQKLYDAGERPSAFVPVLDKTDDVDLKAMAVAGEKATPMPAIREMASVWGGWNDAITLVIQGKQKPEAALKNAATKIRSMIASWQ